MGLRSATLLSLLLTGVLAAPAAAAVTISSPTVAEGGALQFEVVNDTGIPITLRVDDGTAQAGADYTDASPQAPNGRSIVAVQTLSDDALEPDETVLLVHDPLLGDTVTGTGTIAEPALSVADAAVDESAGGVDVTVSSNLPVGRPTIASVVTAAGTADGSDVAVDAFRLTIPAGSSSATLRVPVVDDQLDEDPETFTVTIAADGPTATIADGQATVTITSDDDIRTLSVADARVTESDGANATVRVPVTLSGPTFRTVTAQFATVDLTAKAPRDYLARLGSITIPPGQTQAFIDVAIVSDDVQEKGEQFAVLVGKETGARVADGAAVIAVADDDSAADDADPPNVRATSLGRKGARTVKLRVSCPRNEGRCTGRATFYSAADRRSKARELRRERRLGRRSFRLAGGKSRTLSLRLSRRTLAAARRAGRLRLEVFVVTEDPAGNTDTTTASRTLRF